MGNTDDTSTVAAIANTINAAASTSNINNNITSISTTRPSNYSAKLKSMLGTFQQDPLECDTLIAKLNESIKGAITSFDTKSTAEQMNRFKSSMVAMAKRIKVELLFTSDAFDLAYIQYNEDNTLPDDFDEHLIETLRTGRAIYRVLCKLLSDELFNQTKSHIQNSIYSLWREMIKVITPLSLNTSMRAHAILHSTTIYQGSPDKTFDIIEKNVALAEAFPIEPQLLYTWCHFPEPYKQIVVDAIINGKTTYEKVKFQIRQLYDLQQTEKILSGTNRSGTFAAIAHSIPSTDTTSANDELVHAMKAAIQYQHPHNNGNFTANSFKQHSSSKQHRNKKIPVKYPCKVCGTQDHKLHECPQLEKFLDVLRTTPARESASNSNKA